MVEIFNDIRRLYKFRQPCPELSGLIEFYSETSAEHSMYCLEGRPFTVKLFPSYTPTIWINLGQAYYLQNGNTLHYIRQDQDILLLRDCIVERLNQPSDNIFTVKFTPGALELIMGIEQRKLVHEIFDATAIIPDRIIRKMKSLDTFGQRYILLERFLLDKFVHHTGDARLIRPVTDAIDKFIHSGMQLQTEELAQQLHLSGRTFNRYFQSVTGTNPKSFLSAVRARTALTAYQADKKGFSVYDFGYFDPAHFYKDAVRFTGMKLSSFR